MRLCLISEDTTLAAAVQALNDQWDGIMRYADADFTLKSKPPVFINIWSKKPGLGSLVFRYFISQVGEGNSFLSTDFTDSGRKLFDKLAAEGVIAQQPHSAGVSPYKTLWKVTADPWARLRTRVGELDKETVQKLLAVEL